MAKNINFWKMENYCFWLKLEHFQEKCDPKPCIMMYLGYIHLIHMVPVTFGKKKFKSWKNGPFWAKLRRVKMAWTFFLNFPQFFAWKTGFKLHPEKKFLDISTGPRRPVGQIAIFVKKMDFSGRKWHLFQKFFLFKNDQWPIVQFFSVSKIIFCCLKKKYIFHHS